jgi:hypothetical protein
VFHIILAHVKRRFRLDFAIKEKIRHRQGSAWMDVSEPTGTGEQNRKAN